MLPNYYVTTLAQSLTSGGSETEIFVNSITLPDSTVIAITDFAAENSIGYLVVDPQSSSNVEYISFTGVDGSGIGFTGATRGLSFKGDGSVVAANKLFHATGATVIIGWSSNDLNSFVNKYTAQTISGTITFSPLSATPLLAVGTKSGNQAVSFTDVSNIVSGTIGTATSLTFGTVKVTGSTNTVVSTDDTRMPTQTQANALPGNGGTPSSTNTYATQVGLQSGTETFAVATGSSVAYALTLNPALAAYKAGEVFRFYAAFSSGAAPTLNINGLGAKTMYKKSATGTATLATGDIGTNSFVQVAVDGGLGIQVITPVDNAPTTTFPVYKYGSDNSRRQDAANGTITVAHGLGKIPTIVEAYANAKSAGSNFTSYSYGIFNGTTYQCEYTPSGAIDGLDSSNIVHIINDYTITATVTIDSVNLNFGFIKVSGSGTNGQPVNLLWKVYG